MIQPNGGEEYIAGSDTVITWDGVAPDEKVTIEYRLSETSPWIKLTETATGLSYNFNVPNVERQYLFSSSNIKFRYREIRQYVLITGGTFLMGNQGDYLNGDLETPLHQVL